MATFVTCHRCSPSATIKMHCPSPSCPWAVCPTHGTLKLSADQRRFLAGDDG